MRCDPPPCLRVKSWAAKMNGNGYEINVFHLCPPPRPSSRTGPSRSPPVLLPPPWPPPRPSSLTASPSKSPSPSSAMARLSKTRTSVPPPTSSRLHLPPLPPLRLQAPLHYCPDHYSPHRSFPWRGSGHRNLSCASPFTPRRRRLGREERGRGANSNKRYICRLLPNSQSKHHPQSHAMSGRSIQWSRTSSVRGGTAEGARRKKRLCRL